MRVTKYMYRPLFLVKLKNAASVATLVEVEVGWHTGSTHEYFYSLWVKSVAWDVMQSKL